LPSVCWGYEEDIDGDNIMIRFGFAKLMRYERGFTLIEVLVTLAILSLVMGVTSAAVVTVTKTSSQNTEWNVNLRQVQNAGHWISRDALMSQVVDTNKPGTFLSLSWTEWNGDSYNVDYVLQEDKLMRQLNGSSILVAQYIVTEDTTCEWIGEEDKLRVTIKASLNRLSRYAERTYEINPRPVAAGD